MLGAAMANYGFFSKWLVYKNAPVFKFSSTHFHIHTPSCCLSHILYASMQCGSSVFSGNLLLFFMQQTYLDLLIF